MIERKSALVVVFLSAQAAIGFTLMWFGGGLSILGFAIFMFLFPALMLALRITEGK